MRVNEIVSYLYEEEVAEVNAEGEPRNFIEDF